MTDQEDEGLVLQCVGGERSAFGALVDKYQKAMFNTALRIVNDYEDAADVTQAAFVKAYERLKQFDRKYRFYSWLYRITVNESLTFVGTRRFEKLDEGIASPDKTADEMLSDDETAQSVQQALMALNPDYRAVIVLSHFQELSYREMSDVLGITEKKVKSRLYTARQELKSVLVRKGVMDNAA